MPNVQAASALIHQLVSPMENIGRRTSLAENRLVAFLT